MHDIQLESVRLVDAWFVKWGSCSISRQLPGDEVMTASGVLDFVKWPFGDWAQKDSNALGRMSEHRGD